VGLSICAVLLLLEWLVLGLVTGAPPEMAFAGPINFLLRLFGTPLACLALVGVAIRAAAALSGERGRRAFDLIRTTPLESGSVLIAKWLGSLSSIGRAW